MVTGPYLRALFAEVLVCTMFHWQAVLAGAMFGRYSKTKALMPAGALCVLGVASALYHGASFDKFVSCDIINTALNHTNLQQLTPCMCVCVCSACVCLCVCARVFAYVSAYRSSYMLGGWCLFFPPFRACASPGSKYIEWST
jgi:hypothetical protein